MLCIRADVTKEEDVERAVEEAVKEFGRIDYCASVASSSSPLKTKVKAEILLVSLDHSETQRIYR